MFDTLCERWFFIIFPKKKKKENVQNVQIFKHSGFHLHSIRVYSRQYIKPFGFRLDFYHSTIVFLRIKKIDIPPSETLFHFFFFFPPNVVRFKFTLFNSARWLLLIEQKKKKRKIISPSKHVTYYQRPPDVCLLYPASKRSLTVETSHDGASSLVLEIPTRTASRNSLVSGRQNFHRENGATPPEEFNNGRYLIIFARILENWDDEKKEDFLFSLFFLIHSIG